MAFGQSSGPPASAKQLAYLASLLEEAGHGSFREARHPLDLTQRQAGGKFTGREASELIDRLLANDVGDPSGDRSSKAAERATRRLDEERAAVVSGMPAEVMVMELERRGWVCSPPVER